MTTFTVPDGYEYVTLAGVASVFLTTWQAFAVGGQRRKAGIKYPQMYAEKAEVTANKEALVFNNMQRAHQNTLESYPGFLFTLLFTGLKHPTYAAACGGLWIVGRIFYTLGYRSNAERRFSRGGFFGLLAGHALSFGAAWTVFGLVRKNFDF